MTRNEITPRPMLDIPRSRLEVILDLVAIAAILANIWLIAQSWGKLPDSMAVHFDFSGKPNGWGSKSVLFIPLLVAIIVNAGFFLLSKFPHISNYAWPITSENARRQYQLVRLLLGFLKTEVSLLLFGINIQIIQGAGGNMPGIWMAFPIVSGLLIVGTVGFYLWQAYLAR
jgi:hypothetical protein